MKISSEQLRALQEQEALRKKAGPGGAAFGDILAERLDTAQGTAPAAQTGIASRAVAPASLGEAADGASDISALTREAADRMEGMFDTLDGYAAQIASGGGDLRQAYGLLQDMGKQVADFKARFPNAAAEQPELAAMLNEVDVLYTTETFKFNRGDYV